MACENGATCRRLIGDTLSCARQRGKDGVCEALTYLQLLQAIESLHSLVIHVLTGLSQLEIDHPGPVAPMPVRERNDPLAQGGIAVGRRPVA